MEKEDRIDSCMKLNVVRGHPDMTVKEAALLMAENNVGTLPMVYEALSPSWSSFSSAYFRAALNLLFIVLLVCGVCGPMFATSEKWNERIQSPFHGHWVESG